MRVRPEIWTFLCGAWLLYFLPLALSWGEDDLRLDNPLLPYLLAKVRRGRQAGVVFDAAHGETFPRALLHAMRSDQTLPAFDGELRLISNLLIYRWCFGATEVPCDAIILKN